jgi:hypothetical protein
MLTLRDGKVYVGYIEQLPPVRARKFEYIRILPLWSGYRDQATKEVFKTTDYTKAVLDLSLTDLLIKVVPAEAIVAAGIYVEGTFSITTSRATISRRSRRRNPKRKGRS